MFVVFSVSTAANLSLLISFTRAQPRCQGAAIAALLFGSHSAGGSKIILYKLGLDFEKADI